MDYSTEVLSCQVNKYAATEDNTNETAPQEGEQENGKGLWKETLEDLLTSNDKGQSILPRIWSLIESWDEVKKICSGIKETAEDTLSLLWWIAVGVALFTSLVPVLLVAIVVYLYNLNKKLNALSKQEGTKHQQSINFAPYKTNNIMNAQEASALIMMDINNKVNELLSMKPEDKKYIEYHDMVQLCDRLELIWINKCGIVPEQIQTVNCRAKAVLTPDLALKIQLCKDALVIGGGIAAIIGAICATLGIGRSFWDAISDFFKGTSWTGPLAVAALGAVAVALAGYLMFNNIPAQIMSNMALKALKEGTTSAIDAIWPEYEGKWLN